MAAVVQVLQAVVAVPRTAAIDEEGSRGPSGVHTARCRTPPSPRRRSSRAHPLHTPAAKQWFGRYVGRGVNDVRRRRRSRDASACASFIDPRRCLAPARSRNVPECSESRCISPAYCNHRPVVCCFLGGLTEFCLKSCRPEPTDTSETAVAYHIFGTQCTCT